MRVRSSSGRFDNTRVRCASDDRWVSRFAGRPPRRRAGQALLEFAFIVVFLFGGALSLGEFFFMPLLNRPLVSVMIFDPSYDPCDDGGVYRYPGAIVRNVEYGYETVLIPVMDYENGQETLFRWIAPVEEIRVPVGDDTLVGPFSVVPPPQAPDNFLPGVVALRLNYPAQAAGLIHRRAGTPISGDDSAVEDETHLPSNYELVLDANDGPFNSEGTSRIHAGRYGLGRQAAYYQELGARPFRRIIPVEAIYRREVFAFDGER